MGWNLPPGVTDRMIDEAAQGTEPPNGNDWEDALERLQNSGLQPMESAPLGREITAVVGETLKHQRVFWHDDIFSGGCWMDANGDGATDGVWRHWDNDELIGWLPVPTALNPLIGGV